VSIISREKKMAKKKTIKKKKIPAKAQRGLNIEFHSWTFFIFLLFILVATIILVAQQKGINLLRSF
jgi:hypothetical protein